jgi:MFS family permease
LRASRLPFFYGWIVVGVAFVTMGVAVNARTMFSLLFPPILDEFGWDRGATAGAFSFGFVISAITSPMFGWLMDRRGPRVVLQLGVVAVAAGQLLATVSGAAWQFYLTLGVLVGIGTSVLGFSGQSLYLPHWFERRRGLAMSMAFSGVGIGSIVLLPLAQVLIDQHGWRAASWAMGGLMLVLVAPLNLLVRARPADLGLQPDGDVVPHGASARSRDNVVDPAWAAVDWTLGRALRTQRFWWIALGYFCALYAWYAVQVHQTKYLVEIGFDAMTAAWALGLVSLVAIPGQIWLGHLSDRIGREWVWTIGCLGFVLCYVALLLLGAGPSRPLLYAMVLAQGFLGYAVTSVFGAVPAEIFEGRHYGTIFGTLMMASIGGAAAGPWLAGALFDRTGSYAPGWSLALAASLVAIAAIWRAAPRRVRAVAGRIPVRAA